jgi:hypothetical protein
MSLLRFNTGQLAFGETGEPEPWRRCLISTAPIEIAARIAITIRIGISGEEPPSPEPDVVEATGSEPCSEPSESWAPLACWGLVEPLPWLLWPVPPSPLVVGLPFADAPPDEDPDPEALALPEALGDPDPPDGVAWVPPELCDGVAGLPPVGEGTAFSYWYPDESA